MKKDKFELLSGETMIGNEVVAVQRKVLFSFSPDTGRLYITNQRVCFPDGITKFSFSLDELQCFRNGMLGATTLIAKDGTSYGFTTSSAKKVKEWLRTAGIAEE